MHRVNSLYYINLHSRYTRQHKREMFFTAAKVFYAVANVFNAIAKVFYAVAKVFHAVANVFYAVSKVFYAVANTPFQTWTGLLFWCPHNKAALYPSMGGRLYNQGEIVFSKYRLHSPAFHFLEIGVVIEKSPWNVFSFFL
jgi:hypothetical protein